MTLKYGCPYDKDPKGTFTYKKPEGTFTYDKKPEGTFSYDKSAEVFRILLVVNPGLNLHL